MDEWLAKRKNNTSASVRPSQASSVAQQQVQQENTQLQDLTPAAQALRKPQVQANATLDVQKGLNLAADEGISLRQEPNLSAQLPQVAQDTQDLSTGGIKVSRTDNSKHHEETILLNNRED